MDQSSVSPKHSADASARNAALVALVKRISQGDEAAVAELYDMTSSIVYGLALRVLGEVSNAEEVVLDVYTQVWRQAGTYDEARGAPLAWLLTIARTRSVDRLRSGRQRRQRTEPFETSDTTPVSTENPELAAEIAERRRLVRSALEELNSDQRQAIELAYYSGLSHSEIAARLNEPLGTVKTRIRLGMIKLREHLGPVFEKKE
jgi:RNA polymerase sigma-70 factor, ECF subfamily